MKNKYGFFNIRLKFLISPDVKHIFISRYLDISIHIEIGIKCLPLFETPSLFLGTVSSMG